MNRRTLTYYLGYGLALVVLFFVVLFLLSMLFRFGGGERPGMTPILLLAVTLGVVAYLLLRRVRPGTRQQSLTYTATWALLVAVVTLVITIPNGTTAVVFGDWYDYVVYIAIIGAAYFVPVQTN